MTGSAGRGDADGRTPVRAAVLNRPGHLDLETVFVDAPEPDEVRIRPAHVGLCHSDMHYIDGTHETQLPEVLGHEAAGVVEAVGVNVHDLRVGDHVVTSLTMFCGACRYCVTGRLSLCSRRADLRRRQRPSVIGATGAPIGTMGGVGAFAELLVVRRSGVVKVDDDLPLHVASLFGCAILTGVGAVTRSARVSPGDSVLVIGCGGIGLAAVQGARLAGAAQIVAVDVFEEKLSAALDFGATAVVRNGDRTLDELIRISGGGFDHSFEAVGRRETVELAFAALSSGGTCTVLGMVPDRTPIRIVASDLYMSEKRLHGAFIGSSRFVVDVPQLVALYRANRLQLDEMISHRVPFDRIEAGFELLKGAGTLRVVLDMPSRAGATPAPEAIDDLGDQS